MTQHKKLKLCKEQKLEFRHFNFHSNEYKLIKETCESIKEKYVGELIQGKDGNMMDLERGIILAMDLILSLDESLKNA